MGIHFKRDSKTSFGMLAIYDVRLTSFWSPLYPIKLSSTPSHFEYLHKSDRAWEAAENKYITTDFCIYLE